MGKRVFVLRRLLGLRVRESQSPAIPRLTRAPSALFNPDVREFPRLVCAASHIAQVAFLQKALPCPNVTRSAIAPMDQTWHMVAHSVIGAPPCSGDRPAFGIERTDAGSDKPSHSRGRHSSPV